jgi:succinoglycan biosynthesis transport protein ExoP
MDPFKTSPPQETKLHFLDYWRIIRIRKTIILAVFLLVVITATLVTFILPESFSSTARIKVEGDITDIDLNGSRFVQGYDPYFIQTEFEVIQSEVILAKVIDQLNLNQEWGQRYGNGEALKTSETMEFLKGRMDLRPVRNTKLIEIRVFSHKPDEAQKLANAIADQYQAHRLDQNRVWALTGIDALKGRWKEEEMDLTRAQAEVDKLRSDLKISDPDPMSYAPTPTLSVEAVRMLHSTLLTMESEQVRYETQLKRLEDLDSPTLREAIQTAVGPDSELGSLLADFNLAQQRLLSLEKSMTVEHDDYKSAQKMADMLNGKIDNRVK